MKEKYTGEDFENGLDLIRIGTEDFQIARIQDIAVSLANVLSLISICIEESEPHDLLVEAEKDIKDIIVSLYIIDGRLELKGIDAL
ncbi:MAG: hypothetical protein ACXAC2_15485 [Candidatus Kariarchaeaceae archaeon]|jgi:hypothetical protein